MIRSPAWPPGVPHRLELPERSLFGNLAASAARVPQRPAIHFHGRSLTYAALLEAVERLAGWITAQGVEKGAPVLLDMQNSPQFVIAYYAILRADAAVVPVNPMNRTAELRHLAQDTGARLAICGTEVLDQFRPLLDEGALAHVLAGAYADMADPADPIPLPEALAAQTDAGLGGAGVTAWRAALAAGHVPGPHRAGPDDLAVIPYSSGTTGQPKGCMHIHRAAQATAVGSVVWNPMDERDVHLSVLPFFHVTGMQAAMNGPIYAGGAIVPMTRWNRAQAAALIARHRVTRWRSIATMAIDLVNDPDFASYDLSSLTAIGGGGAAMPEAIAARLKAMTGLDYIEGYGLSETLGATHINPPQAPKRQCLGIPVWDVDARVLSLDDGRELGPGETGEIVLRGPQVFQGYWRRPEATEAAFITLDGQRFFRTGDIGWRDEAGYFFMTDRVKRMINAAGFKVWPAEVEALMLHNPRIAEACVIAARDPRRGETVKAVVVPAPGAADLTEAEVIDWCRAQMAAYKCPRLVEIASSLPKSGAGKVLWRELAAREAAKEAGAPAGPIAPAGTP